MKIYDAFRPVSSWIRSFDPRGRWATTLVATFPAAPAVAMTIAISGCSCDSGPDFGSRPRAGSDTAASKTSQTTTDMATNTAVDNTALPPARGPKAHLLLSPTIYDMSNPLVQKMGLGDQDAVIQFDDAYGPSLQDMEQLYNQGLSDKKVHHLRIMVQKNGKKEIIERDFQ